VPIPDHVLNAPPLMSMTQTAQNVVEMYDLSRQAMDEFALQSHRKTGQAYEKGIYKDEIVPLEVEDPVFDKEGNWVEAETGAKITFDRDEGVRPDTTLEKLAALAPVKGIKSYADKELRITAGN